MKNRVLKRYESGNNMVITSFFFIYNNSNIIRF